MGFYKQGKYIIYQSRKRFVSRELIPALNTLPLLIWSTMQYFVSTRETQLLRTTDFYKL